MIGERVRELARGVASDAARDPAAIAQLQWIARAADEGLSSDAFSTWIDAMARLDPKSAKKLLANWKDIESQGPLFRSQRFKELVKRFTPVAESSKSMGDALGYLNAQVVLAAARTCLVEYKVKGFSMSDQWRRAWKDLESVKTFSMALGEWDAVLSGYELRIKGLGQFPDATTRAEYLTSENIASNYIEMTLFDLYMPASERRVQGSHKSLRRHGLVRE